MQYMGLSTWRVESMNILATCLSGLLYVGFLGIPIDQIPPSCIQLLTETWTVQAIVDTVNQAEATVYTQQGCVLTMVVARPGMVDPGDILEIRGQVVDGMVVITKVEIVDISINAEPYTQGNSSSSPR